MNERPDLLVFSDLDGTLLDHQTYDWLPARPALDRLIAHGAGVVLASSKTAAEITVLRNDMGLEAWPAIVENGCGILESGNRQAASGEMYQTLRHRIADLPAGFRGFGDMDVNEVQDRTGLSKTAARHAKSRCFSEPGVWQGPDDMLDKFLSEATQAGLAAQRGGRFLTLSFGGTKADRMAELIDRFAPQLTIALGDAPNDVQMLELADHGVIVANPASPELPKLAGEALGRIRRTKATGPAGWSEAVSAVLDEIDTKKDVAQHG